MIQAVRAVGLSDGWQVHAACALRLRLACVLAQRRLYATWGCVPLVIERSGLEAAAGFIRPAAAQAFPVVASPEPWRAWPAEPPLANRVTRWWPSDEFPPPEPVTTPEPSVPARLLVLPWPIRGGFVDVWI